MPILLNNPISTGNLDTTVNAYNEVKITEFSLNTQNDPYILIKWIYGNTVSGIFYPGEAVKPRQSVINGDDYTSIVQLMSEENESIYGAAARTLYEYLIDKGYFAGTIQ
jgi:hypothetical protein